MRPARNLAILELATCRRIARLSAIAVPTGGFATPRGQGIATAFAVLELYNVWSCFCRCFYLSACLPARARGGTKVSNQMAFIDLNQAIGHAIRFRNRYSTATPGPSGAYDQKDEPPWHATSFLVGLCRNVGCSKVSDVQAAVSIRSRVFDDLPAFRHFFAHRNGDTCQRAQALASYYCIPSHLRPAGIVAARPLGRPQPLFADWADDLRFAVEYMCS